VIVPIESVPIDDDKLRTEFDKLDETSRIISDKLTDERLDDNETGAIIRLEPPTYVIVLTDDSKIDKFDETSRIISDKLVTDVIVPLESVPIDEDKLETEFDKLDETSRIISDKLVETDEDKLETEFDKLDETSRIISDKLVETDEDKLETEFDKLDETSRIISDKLVETDEDKLETEFDKFDETSKITVDNKVSLISQSDSRVSKPATLPSNAKDNENNLVEIDGAPYILFISFDKLDETSRIISDKLVTDVLVPVESVPTDEDKLRTEFDKLDETS
jgi:hypothetical protein